MKKIIACLMLAACASGAIAARALPESDELLERIRQSWTGVAVKMNGTMTVTRADDSQIACELAILRAGDDRTRVRFLSPKKHSGKVMLMADRKLWLWLPRAKKVTQVPRRRDPFGMNSLFNDLVFDRSEISSAEVTEIGEGYLLELRYHREQRHGPARILFDRDSLLPVRCDFFSPTGERMIRSVLIDERKSWRGIELPASVRVHGRSSKWKEVKLEVEDFAEMTAEDMALCTLEALGGGE
jgi:hypothetical protein